MTIKFLDQSNLGQTKELFYSKNYMGVQADDNFYKPEEAISSTSDMIFDAFQYTYLSGLKNYKAIGKFDDREKVTGILTFYQTPDEPSWYGTQIRSIGGKKDIRDLLDRAIEINENDGRFKFYTLWNSDQTKLLRRFAFSKHNNERYDYVDEYLVPAKTKCIYTSHWHVLFNRVLLPVDTVVRCTFLKQQYRNNLPKGGNI